MALRSVGNPLESILEAIRVDLAEYGPVATRMGPIRIIFLINLSVFCLETSVLGGGPLPIPEGFVRNRALGWRTTPYSLGPLPEKVPFFKRKHVFL